MPGRIRGFTMIEMLVVMAMVAILALMAVPGYQSRMIRDQIKDGLPLADIAKAPVALSWATLQKFPEDNAAAGLPDADKIVNYHVTSVAVENGAIQITFGGKAYPALQGKILSLRPAVVEDAPIVPITWVCGNAAPPEKMTVKGENKTNIRSIYLPLNCRR